MAVEDLNMLRKLPLYPFEWVVLAAVVATLIVFTVFGLPFAPASITYTLGAVAKMLPMTLLVGVVLYGYYHYARGGALKPYLSLLITPAWALLWLRLWLACWVMSFCYFADGWCSQLC